MRAMRADREGGCRRNGPEPRSAILRRVWATRTRVAEEGAAARLRGTALIMPAVVVIGGQWGDEGKGRIVDLIAQGASVVARYSAGNNAGHTVINDLGEFKLNVVPAGIFYREKTCIIGNGVAVDPTILLNEIET